MRAILLILCLAACSPAGPQPEARLNAPSFAEPYYICSVTGDEGMIVVDRSGQVHAPRPTGRACDYEATREQWAAHPEWSAAIRGE